MYSISSHCYSYSKPWEQKHVNRILFIVPVYAVASLLSVLYYKHYAYLQIIGDSYSAIAIVSFFALLCHFVAPTPEEQDNLFRNIVPIKWSLHIFGIAIPIPTRCFCSRRVSKPTGTLWFKLISLGVYQYAFVRVLMAVVSLVTQITGRYCPGSNSPAFAHIWTIVFNSVSAVVAQFFLDQFFHQISGQLSEHRPNFKFWCVKCVLIFSQYQTLIVSLLLELEVLTPAKDVAYPDLKSIPATLLCIELAIVSILHLYAFSVENYRSGAPRKAKLRNCCVALADALNPWDFVQAVTRNRRWTSIGSQAHDKTREQDAIEDPGVIGYVELRELGKA
ncbi:DUF300-domain-containing protein, partial [Aureobasidium melanogenum]